MSQSLGQQGLTYAWGGQSWTDFQFRLASEGQEPGARALWRQTATPRPVLAPLCSEASGALKQLTSDLTGQLLLFHLLEWGDASNSSRPGLGRGHL